MEAPANPEALVGQVAVVRWASMAWTGTVAEADSSQVVVVGGRYNNDRRQFGWAGLTSLKTFGPQPEPEPKVQAPERIEMRWDWSKDDTSAPIGKSVESYFSEDGQVWRADKVEVTVFLNGEMPSCESYGRMLTKNGAIDARQNQSRLMTLDKAVQIEFIQRAFTLLDPKLAEGITKKLHA